MQFIVFRTNCTLCFDSFGIHHQTVLVGFPQRDCRTTALARRMSSSDGLPVTSVTVLGEKSMSCQFAMPEHVVEMVRADNARRAAYIKEHDPQPIELGEGAQFVVLRRAAESAADAEEPIGAEIAGTQLSLAEQAKAITGASQSTAAATSQPREATELVDDSSDDDADVHWDADDTSENSFAVKDARAAAQREAEEAAFENAPRHAQEPVLVIDAATIMDEASGLSDEMLAAFMDDMTQAMKKDCDGTCENIFSRFLEVGYNRPIPLPVSLCLNLVVFAQS